MHISFLRPERSELLISSFVVHNIKSFSDRLNFDYKHTRIKLVVKKQEKLINRL
jgi:hypothetical protein